MSKRGNAQDAQPPSYAAKDSKKRFSPGFKSGRESVATNNSDKMKQAENKKLIKEQGLDLKRDPKIYEETSSDDGKGSDKRPRLKKDIPGQHSASALAENNYDSL